MATYDEAIAAARAQGLVVSERDGEAKLRCPHPEHEDRNPSASLSRANDGGPLFICHSRRCSFPEVLRDGLGLSLNGPTKKDDRAPLVTHLYRYADGRPAFEVHRRGTGESKWIRNGMPGAGPGKLDEAAHQAHRSLIYRLPEITEAVAAGRTVWVVEGEKCADALWRAGLAATTNAGGAGKWRPPHAKALASAEVIVAADDNEPGRLHAQQVVAALPGADALVCASHHDVADCLAAGVPPDELLVHLEPLAGVGAAAARPPTKEVAAAAPLPGSSVPVSSNGSTPHDDLPPPPPYEPFPIDAVPEPIRSWAEATAMQRQVPLALPAFMAMGLASGSLIRRLIIQSGVGWKQELGLYVATALGTAERKSPVVDAASAPMRTVEAELMDRWETQREQAEALDEQPPPEPGVFLDDVTPEALSLKLSLWGERASICTDEGGPLDALAGMYGHLPGTAMQMYLKAHSGSPHRVDRITRPSFLLRRPVMSIAVAVQPTVLEKLAEVPGAIERGLLNRFLLTCPPSLVGRRQVVTPSVPAALEASYARTLSTLYWRFTNVEGELTLTKEATAALVDYEQATESRLVRDLGLPGVQSVATRAPGQALRWAGVYHCLSYGEDWTDPVTVDSMQAGIIMAQWAVGEAQRLYPSLLRKIPIDDLYPLGSTLRPAGADELVAFLAAQEVEVDDFGVVRPRSATLTAIQQRFKRRSWGAKAKTLGALVDWLEDEGEVKAFQPTSTGGRPASRIVYLVESDRNAR